MRVAILARRSTDHQADSIDRQIADARAFAKSRGWTVVEDCIFYVPEGVSGAILSRPELRGLAEAGRQRKIDAVIVQTNDRICRDMVGTVEHIVELRDAGIKAFSYTTGEEYKADSPTDRLMLALKGYVAESERETIISRASQAAFRRARLGFVAGNRLYGYDNVPVDLGGTTFKIRKPNANAAWVVWIHERYDIGWGYRRIATELNRLGVASPRFGRKGPQEWRCTTIRDVILNDSYVGILVFGEKRRVVKGDRKVVVQTPERVERVDASHLQIVDRDLWDRNQARFASNSRATNPRGRTPSALLVGNFRCSACGSRMYVVGLDNRYYCGKRHQSGATTCTNSVKRPSAAIDDAVVRAILAKLDTAALVDAVVAEHRKRLTAPTTDTDMAHAAIAAKVEALKRETTNLTTAISAVSHPAAISALATKLDATQSSLDVATATLLSHATPKSLPDVLDKVALRARAAERVTHLADILRRDIPRGRDALRSVLSSPVMAIPISVNGQPRFLIRGNLRASSVVTDSCSTSKLRSDPKGN